MGVEEQLLAVTPLDGRYGPKVEDLVPIVSEYGLIKYRVAVETQWLSRLAATDLADVVPTGDKNEALMWVEGLADSFTVEDALRVKEIEAKTNHDVKAVEIWLREKVAKHPVAGNWLELIHFGATSEDINNLAYAMMIRDARDEVLIPGIMEIEGKLESMADEHAEVPMLAHTHGQPAVPTTLGKEMAVFADRLLRSADRLSEVAILGKFNGASGNYNAPTFAYPEIDWPNFAAQFVEGLGFEFNGVTTQIEPHDWIAIFSNELALNNTIMTDLARDMWTYISIGYFKQQVKEGEVGSSTMPHKVNPIDFENAEANLGAANALLGFLATKLPISRLQRDLSDSSAQRTIGEAFGHTRVAHASLQKGLGKVSVNEAKIAEDLNNEWAILTEAVQTMMRRYGVKDAYDIMKAASRGQTLSEAGYLGLVENIDIPEEAKARLRKLTPATYVGRAADIVYDVVE